LSDDELPPDVDLSDPFFAEELEKTESNVANKKKDERQKKKKRRKKGEDLESEEDKRRKVNYR
jgi:hypothetical protein